jgi:phosphatidylserine synthase
MFTYPATRLSKFNVMNETCPHCGVRLEPEPGFYQGAMYVGYAFTITAIVIIGIILYLSGDPSEWIYIGTIVCFMLLVVPLNYRYSRILYLHLFGGIKYQPLSQPK